MADFITTITNFLSHPASLMVYTGLVVALIFSLAFIFDSSGP